MGKYRPYRLTFGNRSSSGYSSNHSSATGGGRYAPRVTLGVRKRAVSKSAPKKKFKLAQKTKGKKPPSYTKTMTVKKSTNLQDISQHNDLSERRISLSYPRGSFRFKSLGHYFYQDSFQKVISGPIGDQQVAVLKGTMTYNQLAGVTSNVIADENKWQSDPMLLNPFVNVQQASSYFPGPLPVYAANDRFAVKSISVSLSMLSMEKIAQKVTVMFMLCRHNTTVPPNTQWVQALVAEGMTQLDNFSPANLATTVATAGKFTPNLVGQMPTSRIFTKLWKCIGTHSVVLQPGDQRSIRGHFNVNKSVTREWLTAQSTNLYLGGFSIVPLVIIHGALVAITDNQTGMAHALRPTQVTYGATKVGFLQKVSLNFFALPVTRISTVRAARNYIVADTDAQDDAQIVIDVDEIKNLATAMAGGQIPN